MKLLVTIMVKLPPPVWTLIYLIIAGAISAYYPWREVVDLRVIPLGVLLLAVGFASAFWAAGLFRREGTEINPTSEANKKLVVSGPFRYTRNPMYLGLVLASTGIAFLAGSLPMFVVPVLVFATANWVHIPFEEAKMRRQFGAAFDDYTRRTRRWV
jgi:protein-S-isoprenylcysteine O-methyltransferase Ste14